jgi:DNA-binding NarL/FixJ family response regulator
MTLVANGRTNTQIARRLGISEGTVRTHLEHVFATLDVTSRTSAVLAALPDSDPGRLTH